MKIAKTLTYWIIILPLLVVVFLEIGLQLLALGRPLFFDRAAQETFGEDNIIKVLAIGDSNTYGTYLSYQDSYPKQLETVWNEKHDIKIQVINAGYPGTNSSGIIRNTKRMLDTFKPDVTLLMIGTNDFWSEPDFASIEEFKNPGTLEQLMEKSRAVRLYKLVSKHSFNKDDFDTLEREVLPEEYYNLDIEDIDPELIKQANHNLTGTAFVKGTDEHASRKIDYQGETFSFSSEMRKEGSTFKPRDVLIANLKIIADYSDQSDNLVVFVSYAGNKFFYKAANRALFKAVKERPHPMINVTQKFKQLCPDKHVCPEYLFFDQHATAKGNRIVAELVAENLENILKQRNLIAADN